MLTLSPRVGSLAVACSAVVLFGFSVRASANCSSPITVDCAGVFFRGCFVPGRHDLFAASWSVKQAKLLLGVLAG
jgi:hypothetical protein